MAECLRLLLHLQKAAPAVYRRWHQLAAHRMSHPVIGDTAGICRISMATGGGREHAPARQKDTEPATTATDRKY